MKALYTAQVKATGGREGKVASDDGQLQLPLVMPKGLGGPGGNGTNPEQLFAAGYAACFESALRHVARLQKTPVSEASVTAHVSIHALATGGFGLSARLDVSLPGWDNAKAQALADAAHQVCPYSNATRGNIEVQITVV